MWTDPRQSGSRIVVLKPWHEAIASLEGGVRPGSLAAAFDWKSLAASADGSALPTEPDAIEESVAADLAAL